MVEGAPVKMTSPVRIGVSSAEERRELHSVIDDFERELVPLVAPIVLLRTFVRTKNIAYLEGQTYLYPHPKEMMLRNHV